MALLALAALIYYAAEGEDGEIEVEIERSGGDDVEFELPEDATPIIEALSEKAVAHATP